MESEEDLAARLTERLPIEEAEECLCQLEEHCITVGVLGEADAQDLADELGFTERQCDAVLLDDEAWQARYGQGQAGAPGVQQATTNMAVQEPSGEATPDSNLAENDPGVSSVPDSCDGDGPLLQVSSHRRCAYRSYCLPQAEPRARCTLSCVLPHPPPAHCPAGTLVVALPSGLLVCPSLPRTSSQITGPAQSQPLAPLVVAVRTFTTLSKQDKTTKTHLPPPPFPLTHPHTTSLSLTH